MKLLLTISLFLIHQCCLADTWAIRWEAAKGESTVEWEEEGRLLSDYLFELPAGHSEANHDRKQGLKPATATARQLSIENERRVVQVLLEVPGTYYNRYLLFLVETEPDRFRPMFIYQYSHSSFGFSAPEISAEGEKIDLVISTAIHGTSPTKTTYEITLDKNNNLTTNVRSD